MSATTGTNSVVTGGSASTGTIAVTTGSAYTGTSAITQIDVTKTRDNLGAPLATRGYISNTNDGTFTDTGIDMAGWGGAKQIIRVGKYLFALGNYVNTNIADPIAKSTLQVFDLTTKTFVTSQFFSNTFFTNSIANNSTVSRIEKSNNADGSVTIVAVTVSPITVCKFTVDSTGVLKTRDIYKTMVENTTYHSYPITAMALSSSHIAINVGYQDAQKFCLWILNINTLETITCNTSLGNINDMKYSYDLNLYTISDNLLNIYNGTSAALVLKSSINITNFGYCSGIDLGISANMAAIAMTSGGTRQVPKQSVVFVNAEDSTKPFIRNKVDIPQSSARKNTGSIKNIANVFLAVSDSAGNCITIIDMSTLSGAKVIVNYNNTMVETADSNSVLRKPMCIYKNKIYLSANRVCSWDMYKETAVFGTSVTIPSSIPQGSAFKITSHDISGELAGIQYSLRSQAGVPFESLTILPISSPADITNQTFDMPSNFTVGQQATFTIKITDLSGTVREFATTTTVAPPIRNTAAVSKISCDYGDITNGAQLDATKITYIDIAFSEAVENVGTKIALVSDKTTTVNQSIISANVIRLSLPSGLNFNSSYQLVVPTQPNGGPSFKDYVPALVSNFIINFATAKSPSFDASSTISLVGLEKSGVNFVSNSNSITVTIDTIMALSAVNCNLAINIKTSDSSVFSQVATASVNTNGTVSIDTGSEYIQNLNANGRYISFVLTVPPTWNKTTISAKINLSKKEDLTDKIENTFGIFYNIGSDFTGNPKIGFTNGGVWNFTGEDIIVQISTPGSIVKTVKTNLILLNGAAGAIKGWGAVTNDAEAFQVALDATKLDYDKPFNLTFKSGCALSSSNNSMAELSLDFTTTEQASLIKPQIKPKLYGLSISGAKINEEPESNYTEVITAKTKVILNIQQTNGTDVTKFRYAVGAGSYSEYADYVLDTDVEIFTSQSGEIRVQCMDADGNESPEISCYCKIITAVQYTVENPDSLYTISAYKVYKPNDLFKYVNTQFDKDGNENCINDSKMVIECPVKMISSLKYAFNTTDASLTNATYKSITSLECVGEDITKIILNFNPTERVNNIKFKMRDKLGNETPVITRVFSFDDEPPKILAANIYDAAGSLLEDKTTNNPDIIIKIKSTDESLPITLYISEDGGNTTSAPYTINDGILNTISYTLNDQSNGEKNISLIMIDSAKNSASTPLTKTFCLNKKTIWGSLSMENAEIATNKKIISAVISSDAAVKYKISKTKEDLISGTLEYVEFYTAAQINEIDISEVPDNSVFKLYALISDSSGNTSVIEDSINIKRSIKPQTFTIQEGLVTKAKTITLLFDTTDDVKYYKINNNGKWDALYSELPDTKQATIDLAIGDGKKIIGVMFKDAVGNTTGEIKNIITLDTTPPKVKILPKNGYYVTNDVTFDVIIEHVLDDSADPATHIKFALNDGDYSETWQPLTHEEGKENVFTIPFTPPTDPKKNSFKINAKVKDAMGNVSTEDMSYVFYYDDSPLLLATGIDATGVLKSDALKLVFNKELDIATVNMESVKLQRLYSENSSVAYMPFVAQNKKVLVINATFDYFTMYKLTVTANVSDLAGNFLEKEYSVIFQTEVDPVLTIVSTSIDGEPMEISANSDFTITFGWPMNFSTTNSSNITLVSDYNGELIPCVIKRGVNNYQVKVNPEEELENGVTYTLSVNDAVKNEYGSTFPAGTTKSYKFKTEYIEPLILFMNQAKTFIAYRDKTFMKLSEKELSQNLVKKYGISIKQLSNIPKDVLQTLEEETKIIILANEKYTSTTCFRTVEKTSTVEHVVESIEPNLIHNNYFWSVMNEDVPVEYVKKDKNTIVFAVPKTNEFGLTTVNEELKVLCKIKK